MSWYQDRYTASNMGHHIPRPKDGEGGTYFDIRNAEDVDRAWEYRRLYLNKWLLEQWGGTV